MLAILLYSPNVFYKHKTQFIEFAFIFNAIDLGSVKLDTIQLAIYLEYHVI